MGNGNHDTLVYRLAGMLMKLNQGERLDAYSLADEYGVSLRTIQRDLNVRFAYLPLQKEQEFKTYSDVEPYKLLIPYSGLTIFGVYQKCPTSGDVC